MPLIFSQKNLVEVDKNLYSKIEEKIEHDYFLKHIGQSWYSSTDTISVLKRKDGTVILLEEVYLLNGTSPTLKYKVDEEILSLYTKLFANEK